MRFVDQYGLDVTADSPPAAEDYVEGLELLLSSRVGAPERLQRALELDPGLALARAVLAYQLQFQGNPLAPVAQILRAARDGAHASRREQQVISALRRAIAGDAVAACGMIAVHLEEFPRDPLMIRELVLLQRFGGGAQRKTDIAAELARLAPHFGDDPWFLGLHSLALSEAGDVVTALRVAETGLAARPDHGGLAHSLAHAYFETGDDEGGRDFLESWVADHGDGYLHAGHASWHLALTHLALSEPDRAFALYEDLRGAPAPRRLQVQDAASLMWRLEGRGFDVGAEWEAVLQRKVSVGPSRAFELAHVALAHAALGDEDGLLRLAAIAREEMLTRPHQPFRFLPPLIDALRLVARRCWAEAAPALEHAAAGARRLGGSNEQHTLFDETAAVAYRRAGRPDDARRLENGRVQRRHFVGSAS